MHGLMVALLIVIGVFLFGFVIFFHELGHFLTAKASGIRVNEFAIGMGPKLLSFGKGETKYTLRLLPIGGFCAMEGEDEESSDERAFGNKPVFKRILVVAAGGIFNMILGVVLTFFLLLPEEQFGIPVIAKFTEGSTLQGAGAQVGDRIISVDGYRVYTERDLSFAMGMADTEAMRFVVKRGGEKVELSPFKLKEVTDAEGNTSSQIDFYITAQKRNAGNLLSRSVTDTFSMVRMVVESLKGILTGRFGLNDLAGPVGTAQAISQVTGEALSRGFGEALSNLVSMIVLITVNLGVVNLLPIPALDGGRLLFLLWEAVTRKPVPPKYEGLVHMVGLALLLVLMVVVTFNDILRIFRGGF